MRSGPFAPRFEELPQTLPIFPLTGVLLLPRGKLPLNIFEPRYLAMTEDALHGDRLIGMMQPLEEDAAGDQPPVFPVGCAGRITQFSETDDGRFLITLTGLCRFRIDRELPLFCGYRRVVPEYSAYRSDFEMEPLTFDRGRLLSALKVYLKLKQLSAEWESIESAPGERLVTCLAMICPFSSREKQALLEAPTLPERAKVLTVLLEMAVLESAEFGRAAKLSRKASHGRKCSFRGRSQAARNSCLPGHPRTARIRCRGQRADQPTSGAGLSDSRRHPDPARGRGETTRSAAHAL